MTTLIEACARAMAEESEFCRDAIGKENMRMLARAVIPLVLDAAAAKCLFVSGIIGAQHGSSIDSALREAHREILALKPEAQS